MKWLLLAVGLGAGFLALATLIGSFLPREHAATRMATYRHPPHAVHAAVRDRAALPTWRTGITAVELLPASAAGPRYRETTRHGPITYVEVEDRPSEKTVIRIDDDALPFGGTWTLAFSPTAAGSTLRITENGFVKPALFRFLARFVFGHTATMETYLRDLGRKFGETVEPQP